MSIGIIGTGQIGSSIARVLVRAGLEVSLANRRGPDSLQALLQELGPRARAASATEVAHADIVFVAVNWSRIPDALRGLGDWGGRIVVDTNNPIEAPNFQAVDLGGRASTEESFRMGQLGVAGYLAKPLFQEQVVEKATEALEHAPDVESWVARLVGKIGLKDVQSRVRDSMLGQAIAKAEGSRSGAARELKVTRQAIQQVYHRRHDDELGGQAAGDDPDDGDLRKAH